VNNYFLSNFIAMRRTWEEAKRGFLDSRAILTRAQLDRAVCRDGFYTNTIAPLLNSIDTVLCIDPPVDLAIVCANAAPFSFWSVVRLMRTWTAMRSLCTIAYENWSASGQNDHSNFNEESACAAFHDFNISAPSVCLIALFTFVLSLRQLRLRSSFPREKGATLES
jgi:hypothetical protein